MSLAPHLLVAATSGAGLGGVADGDVVPVPVTALHHLRRVLRLADGAPVSLTDGAGHVTDAVLAGDGARCVGAVRTVPRPVPRLTLLQALSKGRRAEDAVRVACELGVDRIVPVVAARTQGRTDARGADALVARWDAVAVAALEQSRGAWRATVDDPVPVDVCARTTPSTVRLVAVPGAEPLPVALTAAQHHGSEDVPPEEVAVAVGPEGGWTAEEVALLVAGGWHAVGLGPTVLRTEHAGPIAVAVLAALLGRWGVPCDAAGTAGAAGVGVGSPARPSRSTGTL